MSSIKEAKLKLQDELLDLIAKFEKEWDADVYAIGLEKRHPVGDKLPNTVYVIVGVQV